jgi:glycosyltransferase involved in cell wall biosynthesis
MTKVDVCMATYNHSTYVKDAVESIKKNAEHVPLQLWIVDDGSTDGTVDYLKSISEDFINVSYKSDNTGAGATINEAMSKGSSEFVAIINSDDVWNPRKLEMQLQAYEKGYGDVIFTLAEYIDQNGEILKDGLGAYTPHTFRTNDDWTSKEWLQMVCFGGNCLCTPSVLGTRRAFMQIGGYDNRYRQIPDIELWSRLFQTQKPFVLPNKLVQFRLHPENTSKSTQDTKKRHAFEAKMIMNNVFLSMNKDILAKYFGVSEEINIPLFDQVVNIISKGRFYGMQLALELIHENLENQKYESNISAIDLHKISGGY